LNEELTGGIDDMLAAESEYLRGCVVDVPQVRVENRNPVGGSTPNLGEDNV
jgi:hypothetical protein